ncbi:MAG: hypothetical protein ACFB0Z_06860 [Candidatus Phaeomarinobacter sp.]
MDDLEISAAAIGWDDEAREALSNPRLSPGDDPIMAVEWYEREVREGRVNLIRYSDQNDRPVAHAGWWIDRNAAAPDGGDEFVIAGAVSALPKVDMVAALLPGLEAMAREHGCVSIRFHTQREGLSRKVEGMGWERSEIVMRRAL